MARQSSTDMEPLSLEVEVYRWKGSRASQFDFALGHCCLRGVHFDEPYLVT